MGAAQSSNAASAIANVSNFVNNSTTASSSAVSQIQDVISLENCQINLAGDFNAKESATLMQKNNQIIAAKQDSNVTNNIAQQLNQTATSTVGSLGIGYADASNSASEMVNDTNQIINAMTVGCSQYSSINQSFKCDGSTIRAKNLNIGFSSTSDFLSSQTLNNDQVANVVNDISQTITQKATATVEGISGMLLMILIAIAVIIYVAMKPLSSGPAKMIVGVSMCFLLVGIVMIMYLRGTPPFFSSLNECINNSSIGKGSDAQCVNTQQKKIVLGNPPFKYIYGLTPTDTSRPGANLVQMAIAAKSGQTISTGSGVNGGYTMFTQQVLDKILTDQTTEHSNYIKFAKDLNIPPIPNPLYVPKSSDGYYYKVPDRYSNNPNSDNLCTPGTVQAGGTVKPDNDKNKCPLFADLSDYVIKDPTTVKPENTVANLNLQDWDDYINMRGKYPKSSGYKGNDEATVRALFARFVLCDIIGGNIELHHYVNPKEYIKFNNKYNQIVVALAGDENGNPNYPNDTYLYHPYSFPGSWTNGAIGPGYILGQVGVVDDNSYRFQKFMRNIGGYILIAIVGAILLYMFYLWYKNKDADISQPEQRPLPMPSVLSIPPKTAPTIAAIPPKTTSSS